MKKESTYICEHGFEQKTGTHSHAPTTNMSDWANRLSKIIKEQETFPASWSTFYSEVKDFLANEIERVEDEHEDDYYNGIMQGLKEGKEPREQGVFYPDDIGCCEECIDVHFEKTYPAHTAYYACANLKCKCHAITRTEKENYERDHSHQHCWESNYPCGNRILHLRCCLCETANPKVAPTKEKDHWCNDSCPCKINKTPTTEKESNDFSDFIHNASPEEKKRVWLEIAKEASAEQRKLMASTPNEEKIQKGLDKLYSTNTSEATIPSLSSSHEGDTSDWIKEGRKNLLEFYKKYPHEGSVYNIIDSAYLAGLEAGYLEALHDTQNGKAARTAALEEVKRIVEGMKEYKHLDIPDTLIRKLDLLANLPKH